MCVISFNGRKGDEEGERCMNAAAVRAWVGVEALLATIARARTCTKKNIEEIGGKGRGREEGRKKK
jgi:hypothetical protein